MKSKIFATFILALSVFVTRPLHGQVYPSGSYPPYPNAVPFWDNIGTPSIGSAPLLYDPGSNAFQLSANSFTMGGTNFDFYGASQQITLLSDYQTLNLAGSNAELSFSGSNQILSMSGANPILYLSGSNAVIDMPSSLSSIASGTVLYNYGGNLYWGSGQLTTFPATDTGQSLYFNSSSAWVATTNFYNNGTNIGIGTYATAGYRLSVEGKVRAREMEVNPDMWSDFVFDKNYKLSPLDTLERQIATLKHLPDMPAAGEVAKNGIKVGEMDALLLKKVEELTLYIIQQQKEIDALKAAQTNNIAH